MIISKMGNDYSAIMPDERTAKIMGELMKMLASEHGKKVLDVGCGDGSVAFILSGMGMKVVGVDKNQEKVAKARAKGLEALVVDSEGMFFDKEFDTAFSINSLHKMRRPTMVLDSIYRALKPEGRFIGEIAGENNDIALNQAIITVLEKHEKNGLYLFDYYQPSIEDYREKLEMKGFLVRSIETVNYSIPVEDDFDEWLSHKLYPFMTLFENKQLKQEFVQEVKEELTPMLKKDNGNYLLGQSSILFYAIKKGEDE
ncbi:MAG: Demethylrebeccamycin-D-glucose O-methyltransferase [Alphaproteobacteria bacterium ADurb.Bin438]|nr:MAG: Demethylrebeccamycin-D-glucose O-methyltransferase [Alphaproteobacteria bacterium ADurb.Bin438]